MLTELHIQNFAIIDHLDLEFDPGLITFTGETGAGKSIIIDAVETLLGGRADATFVRTGAERAIVEGLFRIPASTQAAVLAILEREDLLDDSSYLTLAREIRLNGRNTARVNGRTMSTALLRELGEYLIDVHGQSEHLSLLRVNQHRGLLDGYARSTLGAELSAALVRYQETHRRYLSVRRELDELRQMERDSARRMDMLTFQINEIESARLKPGEEEDLRDERNRLANAEGLASSAQEALLALDEGDPENPAAADLMGKVVHALAALSRLDPSQAELHDQSSALHDAMSDLAAELRVYLEGIEFNPKRLDQVEERLALLHSLKRKYGDSIPGILEFAETTRQQLDQITNAGERIEALQAETGDLLARLGEDGLVISRLRQEAAEALTSGIEKELGDLHMSGARFQVAFDQQPDPEGAILPGGERLAFDAHGLERVEFLIAPNPGEGFKPLARTASGGETSRLMLALKNVLAKADEIPTLIFDEIDQGIGGRVGSVVGEKLWSLARQHQVLCITHLPQLAAFGEQHFQVKKQVTGDRTTTQVSPLQGEARLVELAQMLGEVSEATLRSAQDLVDTAGKRVAAH